MPNLNEMAHFDRCFSPDDLLAINLPPDERKMLRDFVVHERALGRHCGIVKLYQEFIMDEDIRRALQNMVNEHAAAYPMPEAA